LRSQRLLVSGSIVLQMAYLWYTGPYERGHDVGGHIDHVEVVASGNLVTKADDCGQCHHPPIYYWVAAVAAAPVGVRSPAGLFMMQLVSVAAMTGFRIVAATAIAALAPTATAATLGTLLAVFWPATFLRGVGVGNDALFYFLFAMGYLEAVRWFRSDGDRKTFLRAAGYTALAILTKSNGVVLVALLAALWAVRGLRAGKLLRHETYAPLAVAALLAIVPVLSLRKGDPESHMPSAAGFAPLAVGDQPANFLYFDLPTFMREPFTSAWTDALGRQYFLNYMLKTSLFGEFDWRLEPVQRDLGRVISGLSLLLLLGLAAMVLTAPRQDLWNALPSLLLAAGGVLALAAFRYRYPASCTNDFRYIAFIVIPCAELWTAGYDRAARGGTKLRPHAFAAAVAVAFIVLFVAFLTSPLVGVA
jgi:hypothetical protein